MNLGKNILKNRKIQKLSQEDLAEKVDVTRQTISNWELGETSPTPEQLKKLSKIFKVSIDELLDNDVKSIIVEKVSNTEKLAGIIINVLKVIGILFIIFILIDVIAFICFVAIRNSKEESLRTTEIMCTLHDKEYLYEFTYYEESGQIKYAGGDAYLNNITDIEKESDAHKAIDIIDAYVKNNGGTCTINED